MTYAPTLAVSTAVHLSAHGAELNADLAVPPGAQTLVIIADAKHRTTRRSRRVADALQDDGYATLVVDLLSSQEATLDPNTTRLLFDVPLLSTRLGAAADWARFDPNTQGMRIALFGMGAGTSTALATAAMRPDIVSAVVTAGGRADLAGRSLGRVQAPALLIAGGNDGPAVAMAKSAAARLPSTKELFIVPRAGHHFEEPGAIEEVAQLALRWFERYAPTRVPAPRSLEIC